MKTIEANYVKGSQSHEFIGIYNLDGFKLKVHIDRDSYDSQSHANIYVWKTDKLEWSNVGSIHYSQMEVCKKLSNGCEVVFVYRPIDEGMKRYFQADVQRLFKLAKQILF